MIIKMSAIKKQLLMHKRSIIPTVLFTSFEGQYNDNPKYIAEALYKIKPDIRLIWAVSEKSKETLPEYLVPVEYNSEKYNLYSLQSHVLIDNSIGYRWKALAHGEMYPRFLFSKKNQLNISTWHGTPIKYIGRHSDKTKIVEKYVSSADYLLSGCTYTYEKLKDAFPGIHTVLCGTPRNDVLTKKLSPAEISKYKMKLGFPGDKKILLYAPTFRSTIEESGIIQLKMINLLELLSSLEKKFGGDWIFVFRVHHSVLLNINIEEISFLTNYRFFDGNRHDDMADYLNAADALITDYSGSAFDFALTDKPCFLFTPDIKKYEEERGTYFSVREFPYPIATSSKELCDCVLNYDHLSSLEKRNNFNKKIGNVETGETSDKIAKAIVNFLETGNKENLL